MRKKENSGTYHMENYIQMQNVNCDLKFTSTMIN